MAIIAVQILWKAWNAPTKYCLLGSLPVMRQPYLWFNTAVPQYQILLQESDGLVLVNQAHMLLEAGPPLLGLSRVDAITENRTSDVEKAI